jgi:Na+/melibiose symporter-like transporter
VAQALHVQTGIRYMMSFCPAVAGLLSAALVLLYNLDDTTMVEIERDLKQRRLSPSSAGT